MTTCHPIGDVCPETCGGSSVHVGGGVDDGGACASNNSWSVVKREVVRMSDNQLTNLDSIVGQEIYDVSMDWLGCVHIQSLDHIYEVDAKTVGAEVRLTEVSGLLPLCFGKAVESVMVFKTVNSDSTKGFSRTKTLRLVFPEGLQISFTWGIVAPRAGEIELSCRSQSMDE